MQCSLNDPFGLVLCSFLIVKLHVFVVEHLSFIHTIVSRDSLLGFAGCFFCLFFPSVAVFGVGLGLFVSF